MTAVVFLPIVGALAAAFAYLFLVGDAELEDILERWRQDQRDREAMRRHAEQQRVLRGPRAIR